MSDDFHKISKGIVIKGVTSDPTSNVSNGDVIYNTTENKFKFRQNGVWVDLGTIPGTPDGGPVISPDDFYRVDKGFKVKGQTSAPTVNVTDGSIYYDTTENKFKFRQNGVWVDLGV